MLAIDSTCLQSRAGRIDRAAYTQSRAVRIDQGCSRGRDLRDQDRDRDMGGRDQDRDRGHLN